MKQIVAKQSFVPKPLGSLSYAPPLGIVENDSCAQYRPSLQRAAMGYVDVQDQPKSSIYLVIESSPVANVIFAVDNIEVADNVIRGVRGSPPTTVVEFSPTIPWYSVRAEYVDIITMEEALRRQAADAEQTRKFRKELEPKTADLAPEDYLEKTAGHGQYL